MPEPERPEWVACRQRAEDEVDGTPDAPAPKGSTVSDRLDSCGVCLLVFAVGGGFARAAQASCPAHGIGVGVPDGRSGTVTTELPAALGSVSDGLGEQQRAKIVAFAERREPAGPGSEVPAEALDAATDRIMVMSYQRLPRGVAADYALMALQAAAPHLLAAGRAQAAADIRDAPYPDPSPCIPAWHAGYTEATDAAVRIATEGITDGN